MVEMYIAYQYKNESGTSSVSAVHYLDIPKFLADYPDAIRVTELQELSTGGSNEPVVIHSK